MTREREAGVGISHQHLYLEHAASRPLSSSASVVHGHARADADPQGNLSQSTPPLLPFHFAALALGGSERGVFAAMLKVSQSTPSRFVRDCLSFKDSQSAPSKGSWKKHLTFYVEGCTEHSLIDARFDKKYPLIKQKCRYRNIKCANGDPSCSGVWTEMSFRSHSADHQNNETVASFARA